MLSSGLVVAHGSLQSGLPSASLPGYLLACLPKCICPCLYLLLAGGGR